MKKLILSMAVIALAGSAMAQSVSVERHQLGSGKPGKVGFENAMVWDNNIYHAPQYMPGYPTAAVLWPRVVNVACVQDGAKLKCNGYNWLPEMGRGEYLMIRPVVVPAPVAPAPAVAKCCESVKEVFVPVPTLVRVEVPGPIREIYIEVPAKPKGQ